MPLLLLLVLVLMLSAGKSCWGEVGDGDDQTKEAKKRGKRIEPIEEWSFKVSVVVALVVLDQPQNCSFLQMAVAQTKPN